MTELHTHVRHICLVYVITLRTSFEVVVSNPMYLNHAQYKIVDITILMSDNNNNVTGFLRE